MRWYHWILAYMIIGGGFALAVIGDQLGGWFVLGCVLSMAAGVLGIKYLPAREETVEDIQAQARAKQKKKL